MAGGCHPAARSLAPRWRLLARAPWPLPRGGQAPALAGAPFWTTKCQMACSFCWLLRTPSALLTGRASLWAGTGAAAPPPPLREAHPPDLGQAAAPPSPPLHPRRCASLWAWRLPSSPPLREAERRRPGRSWTPKLPHLDEPPTRPFSVCVRRPLVSALRGSGSMRSTSLTSLTSLTSSTSSTSCLRWSPPLRPPSWPFLLALALGGAVSHGVVIPPRLRAACPGHVQSAAGFGALGWAAAHPGLGSGLLRRAPPLTPPLRRAPPTQGVSVCLACSWLPPFPPAWGQQAGWVPVRLGGWRATTSLRPLPRRSPSPAHRQLRLLGLQCRRPPPPLREGPRWPWRLGTLGPLPH